MKVNEIIDRLGGTRPVAARVGLRLSSVRSWQWNGHIPEAHYDTLLEMEAARDAGLTREDLQNAEY